MKKDNPVARATLTVALGVLILSLIMEAVYLVLVFTLPALSFHYSFPLGNVYMAAALVLNFFLMSVGLQRAVDTGDEKRAKKVIQFSHAMRTLMLLVLLVLACVLPCFHPVSSLITVFFPQLTVFITHFAEVRREKKNRETVPPAEDKPDGETPPDGISDAADGEGGGAND